MGYLDLGIRALHEAFIKGETTPREVAEEAIRRAKESKDNALEATCYEEALSFASSLKECEKGNLLWGVPYFAKDNFSTEGVETTASSNILKGYVPVFDAEVVRRLKEKKAVLLGKTTLDELAMGGTGTSGHLGKTYNPWDESHRRMVGGSSCGSAALVAEGAVPFALGSDTGDSVRKPAGYAGLVGIKPTWGRISRFGLFPFAPSLDAVGYFTRSVDDAAILLETLAGRDEKDSTSSQKPVDSYRNYKDIPVSGMKVAVLDDLMDTIREKKIAKDIDRLLSRLEERGVEIRIDMHLKKNKTKGIAVCGIPIKKASELFGNIHVVFFSPEDLNIIKNGPSERRRFIDMELCQLDPVYTASLVAYNKALGQRNLLLKELSFRPEYEDTLPVWDQQLSRYGAEIIKRRREFILELNDMIADIHRKITGGREELSLSYEPDCGPEEFFSVLEASRQKDIKNRVSSRGPHRDDMVFLVNGIDIRRYGSQGQQRSAALSLKLSEIEMIRRTSGDTPVLLLDDVLSELDSRRQNHLLESIRDVQTIITCTGLDDFVNSHFSIDQVYHVSGGSVIKETS